MINIKGYKINKFGTWWTKSHLLLILICILICIVILSIDHILGKAIPLFILIFLISAFVNVELNDLLILKYKIQITNFKDVTTSFKVYKLQVGLLFIVYWEFIKEESDLIYAEKLINEDKTKVIKNRIKFFYKEKGNKETKYY